MWYYFKDVAPISLLSTSLTMQFIDCRRYRSLYKCTRMTQTRARFCCPNNNFTPYKRIVSDSIDDVWTKFFSHWNRKPASHINRDTFILPYGNNKKRVNFPGNMNAKFRGVLKSRHRHCKLIVHFYNYSRSLCAQPTCYTKSQTCQVP